MVPYDEVKLMLCAIVLACGGKVTVPAHVLAGLPRSRDLTVSSLPDIEGGVTFVVSGADADEMLKTTRLLEGPQGSSAHGTVAPSGQLREIEERVGQGPEVSR